MLKQRVIFGVLGVILAIAVITLCPVYIIGICVGIIALLGLGEFFNVVGVLKSKYPCALFGFLFCIAASAGTILLSDNVFEYMLPACLIFVFLLMLGMVLFRKETSFDNIAAAFTGTLYITVFFLHILLIRQLELGKILIWILFISAWATDTFAYFCGKSFGKHKLCPNISPKKTVEGAIGGMVGCIICIFIYCVVIASVNKFSINIVNLFILSAASSVFSQFGDLAASCIKRDNGVKDYGNLIPGHGGILDRFDSVLLIAPLVYYLTIYLPVFNAR